MKLLVVLFLIFALFILVKRRLLQVDLSFPWLFGLVLIAALSMHDGFVVWIADLLGIVYAPIAIILIAIFILLGLLTILAIVVSRLRQRQIMIVRRLAQFELDRQLESSIVSNDSGQK